MLRSTYLAVSWAQPSRCLDPLGGYPRSQPDDGYGYAHDYNNEQDGEQYVFHGHIPLSSCPVLLGRVGRVPVTARRPFRLDFPANGPATMIPSEFEIDAVIVKLVQ